MTSIWIDQKYANQLQFKLERFKVKKTQPYLANFRCPFCGDSERTKSKTRAYIITHKGRLVFKCHNCQLSMSFSRFLEKQAPGMYDEYRLEILKELGGESYTQRVTQTQYMTSPIPAPQPAKIEGLVKITTLMPDHPVRQYVDARQIPTEQQFRLFYTDAFMAFTNSILPGKFESIKNDSPRLVMLLKNRDGKVIGFQGRDLNKVSSLRYISIMIDDSHPKVFGLEVNQLNKDSFIFEGPIDSLFVDNALGMAGASVSNVAEFMDPKRAIFVYDNEPRNKQIVNAMRDVILQGYRIVIFPDRVQQKDINDMILHGGMCREEISVMLHKNTYIGAAALMRLNEWRRD